MITLIYHLGTNPRKGCRERKIMKIKKVFFGAPGKGAFVKNWEYKYISWYGVDTLFLYYQGELKREIKLPLREAVEVTFDLDKGAISKVAPFELPNKPAALLAYLLKEGDLNLEASLCKARNRLIKKPSLLQALKMAWKYYKEPAMLQDAYMSLYDRQVILEYLRTEYASIKIPCSRLLFESILGDAFRIDSNDLKPLNLLFAED